VSVATPSSVDEYLAAVPEDTPFTFVAATRKAGAEYSHRLSSSGLTKKHSYYLLVQASSDPGWQAVQFTD
jgi:hypothetical protein